LINLTTKCNFEQLGFAACVLLVFYVSRSPRQSRHNLYISDHNLNDIRFMPSWKTGKPKARTSSSWIDQSTIGWELAHKTGVKGYRPK